MKLQRFMAGLMAMSMVVLIVGGITLSEETYTVVSDIPWPPFEMELEGEFFGFDLDVIRAIGIAAGFEVDIQNCEWSILVSSVQAGAKDIGASGLTDFPERAEKVDFSNHYWLSNQAVVIRKDSGLNLVSALTGMGPTGAVGAQRATTGGWWVEDNLQAAGFDVELKQYATYPLAILDLVAKRTDAVVQDEPASIASLTAFPDDLTIAGIINTHEYFGFIVPKGDPNGLLPRINDAMVTLGLKSHIVPTGIEELEITEGSFWDNLVSAYFGPSTEEIEAAWSKCKGLLHSATCLEDLENYARCMADAVK
jgi:polar amino acid transport system substrate-binding protein